MIHKQLRRCCIVNYFGTSCILLLHCHRVTCWGGKPAPSPEGGLGHSSFLSGKGTPQWISPFVMSSLLTFSVCLGQLLWFKAKWLIKQTNFSGTLYTRRQSHEEVCVVYLTHPFPVLICSPSFPETKERWQAIWNMHTFREDRKMFNEDI